MTDSKSNYENIALAIEGVELSQMFGKPCAKYNSKAFLAFFENEMVFKIGKIDIQELLLEYPGSKNWDPSGKNSPMKDWIQVPNNNYSNLKSLAEKAFEFNF